MYSSITFCIVVDWSLLQHSGQVVGLQTTPGCVRDPQMPQVELEAPDEEPALFPHQLLKSLPWVRGSPRWFVHHDVNKALNRVCVNSSCPGPGQKLIRENVPDKESPG